MGTFFLPDAEYRMPSPISGGMFRRDNNQQGPIFENNLCFANIKRGLGFGSSIEVPNHMSGGSGSETVTSSDSEWNYNTQPQIRTARSSPVVERLILQELQNEISDHSISIGIPMDPKQWTVEDTRKWLDWFSRAFQVGDQSRCLPFDGQALCNYKDADFVYFTGSEDIGINIAQQLDLWKNATKMMPSAGSYQFHHQQAMVDKLGLVPIGRQDNNTPKLLDSSCSWPVTSQQYPTNTYTMLSSNEINVREESSNVPTTPTSEPPRYQNMTNAPPTYHSFGMYNNQSPQQQLPQQQLRQVPQQAHQMTMQHLGSLPAYATNELQGRNTPKPTIPLDRFRSVREACQQQGFLSYEKYQEFTSTIPPRQIPHTMSSFSSHKEDLGDSAPNPIVPSSTYSNINMPCTSGADHLLPFSIKEEVTNPPDLLPGPPHLSRPDVSDMIREINVPDLGDIIAEYGQMGTTELKTEDMDVSDPPSLPDAIPGKPDPGKRAKKKSSKHPIHLWEFLKQLLCEGKECIRWIDQAKGIFKIYNSQEVAKFWGERKNRPAMNYDKLSRSIRQYYKKGIIKKTCQGKRLVYQFCPGYI